MILIVDFSPELEEMLVIEGFSAGAEHRCREELSLPGGTGIRIARAVASLGERVTVSGFVGGAVGQTLKLLLFNEGIPFNLVDVRADSRRRIFILDHATGLETHVIGLKPEISDKDLVQFNALFKSLGIGVKAICFTGRVPDRFPRTVFSDLIRSHRGRKTIHVVYSDMEGIRGALPADPFLCVIDQEEVEHAVNVPAAADERFHAAVNNELNLGPGYLVVLRDDGSVVVAAKSGMCSIEPPLTGRRVKRSGGREAFVAGAMVGQLHTGDFLKALAQGIAAQADSEQHTVPAKVDRKAVSDLQGKVEVQIHRF